MTITDKAITKMSEFIAADPDAIAIRVGVKGGGCSGFQYILEIAKIENSDDRKIEQAGVTVYIDRKSYIFLIGTEIDYEEGLMAAGFKFNNPSAKRSCGCGESFSV